MLLSPRRRGIRRVSPALCRGRCAVAASRSSPHHTLALWTARLLQLCVGRGDGPWHAHQGAGPPPDTMPQSRLPVPQAYVGRSGAGWGCREWQPLDLSLASLISRGGPAFRQQPTRTPPTGTHTKLYVPPTRTASSRPRNAELLAGREGGQRQQMAAATVLGVILAWFVLGQMAELNGLLACLSRILFIWKSQSPGKQQVVAQRGYSGIRRLLDERVLFCSVIWHPCTGCKCLCVAECVCVCVCLCHS